MIELVAAVLAHQDVDQGEHESAGSVFGRIGTHSAEHASGDGEMRLDVDALVMPRTRAAAWRITAHRRRR
jgi:hypothetical protein